MEVISYKKEIGFQLVTTMSSSAVQVEIKPIAAFCLKCKTLSPGVYQPPQSTPKNALEIGAQDSSVIPVGLKVFINVAYDSKCPSPPDVHEDVIQRAMAGVNDEAVGAYFVPVIVSHGRRDKDKNGSPSLVFDAVFNLSLKSRVLRDPDFREFVIELALQNTESLSSLALSRPPATPNIRSKGTPLARTVLVPRALFPVGHPHRTGNGTTASPAAVPSKPRIEEILPTKSILKSTRPPSTLQRPEWTWTKDASSILVTIQLPHLTHAHIPDSTLDLEPHRLMVCTPLSAALDINLTLSDAELTAKGFSVGALMLKKERELDVDGASAEWRVEEGVLVVRC